MENLLKDIRYGVRGLWKRPGFTVVAVLTLALGIGANTAIFSVVNAVLLRPLQFRDPDRLAMIWEDAAFLGFPRNTPAPANYVDWKNQTQSFEDMAATHELTFNLTGGGTPERVAAYGVNANFFPLFGVAPALGRGFTAEEDQPNNDREVVLSFNTWKSILGGDPAIVGSSIQLNQQPYKIIGVMGANFDWPGQTDLWAPLALAPKAFVIDNIFNENYFAVARLQPNVKFSEAATFLNMASQQVIDDPRAKGYPGASGWGLFAVPFTEFVYGDVRTPLLILLGAVGFVLLIACSNVAGLLLARASGRKREISIRAALGASRARIITQLLTEAIMLALAGGVLGLGLALIGRDVMWRFRPPLLPAGGMDLSLDWHVLGFTMLVAIGTGVIFGLVPALQSSRPDLVSEFKERAGGDLRKGSRFNFRNFLISAQVGVCLIALVGAGLFLLSLRNAQNMDPGFDTHNLAMLTFDLGALNYDTARAREFERRALEAAQNTPGIDVFKTRKHLFRRPLGHVHNHVQAPAMAHSHDQFHRAILTGTIENFVHQRDQGSDAFQ